MAKVAWDPASREEVMALPGGEKQAVMNAVAKLEALGDQLGAPHSSNIKGSPSGIRELRPRAGRCAWRAIYRRVGGRFVILAIGPDAQHDEKGFDRAVGIAEQRLKEIEK